MFVQPVPPYTTPMDVVAETRPLFAWSGPLRVDMVRPPCADRLPFTRTEPSN